MLSVFCLLYDKEQGKSRSRQVKSDYKSSFFDWKQFLVLNQPQIFMKASAIAANRSAKLSVQRRTFVETAKRNILRCSMLNLISILSSSIAFSLITISPSVAQLAVTLENKVEPNPLILEGVSGGSLKATEIVQTESTATGFCNGFIAPQPNHILELKSFFEFLKIEVNSSTDTTIIIEGPGGIWCNDDSDDANPAIEGQWQPGNYKIWIGSYQEDSSNSYQIRIMGKE